ncbi:hypothetical protein ACFQU7_00785 [Pseudoroseomonas wenyumeiae]
MRVSPAAKDCVLDIKVEYEGGQAEEKMEVDACRLDQVIFTNLSGRAEGPGGTARGLHASPAPLLHGPGMALAGRAGFATNTSEAFADRRPQERRHVAARGQPETAWP